MMFSRSFIEVLLLVTNVYATLSSKGPDDGDSGIQTLVSTSLDTDIKCRTIMTKSFTGEVLTKTETVLQTKTAKYLRSVVTPPVSTIYKDVANDVVETTTSFVTSTVTADAHTHVISSITTMTEETTSILWRTEWFTTTETTTVFGEDGQRKRDTDSAAHVKRQSPRRVPLSVSCREVDVVQTTYVKIRTRKAPKTTVAPRTRSVTRTVN